MSTRTALRQRGPGLAIGAWRASRLSPRPLTAVVRRGGARPELLGLMALAATLNLWGLSINGWANTYYSAAVRSMTTSWHDFLFASLDRSGLMTVDKPPLSLWVQALSARVFGFHPLSMLLPQALMGIAATALVYDLTRRRFGRPAGFAAGFALAVTPIVVAVSRHNNPDELLALCCVAALWFALRALERGETKWLVLCGVCVGLGFETKMGVALMVVPGIAVAYLWVAPRGRIAAIRPLLAGGAALAAVGLAWPLVVTLTPATDRPWIAGTSDNCIWSLMFGYNGVGRIVGQTGGPGGGGPGGGGGGGLLGGSTGVFRLLGSSLGDQAGWLLGFALVAGVAVLVSSRLRRADARTGWLIAVGGGFASSVVVFSFASGIFHAYYVSFLAAFTAALIGAGVGQALSAERSGRVVAPLAVALGVVTEVIVLGTMSGELAWAMPLVIVLGALCAGALALALSARVRAVVLAVGLVSLFAAPATWAVETIGHAASGTFPAGGPASASIGGFVGPPGGGGPGLRGLRGRAGGFGPVGGLPGFGRLPGFAGANVGPGASGAPPGAGGAPPGAGGAPPGGAPAPSVAPGVPGSGAGALGRGRFGSRAGLRGGGLFGGYYVSLPAAIKYADAHGGGTMGVSSQTSAAAAILASDANVAGLGGFSGRESSVTATWLAMEVRSGRLRWVIDDAGQGFGGPRDTRQGSRAAMATAAKACAAVPLSSTSAGTVVKMYDCRGRAAAILTAAAKP